MVKRKKECALHSVKNSIVHTFKKNPTKNRWRLAHKKLFDQNRNEKLKCIMLTSDYSQDFVIVFHFNLIISYSVAHCVNQRRCVTEIGRGSFNMRYITLVNKQPKNLWSTGKEDEVDGPLISNKYMNRLTVEIIIKLQMPRQNKI